MQLLAQQVPDLHGNLHAFFFISSICTLQAAEEVL